MPTTLENSGTEEIGYVTPTSEVGRAWSKKQKQITFCSDMQLNRNFPVFPIQNKSILKICDTVDNGITDMSTD